MTICPRPCCVLLATKSWFPKFALAMVCRILRGTLRHLNRYNNLPETEIASVINKSAQRLERAWIVRGCKQQWGIDIEKTPGWA